MLQLKWTFIFLLTNFVIYVNSEEKGHYTILAPGTIRPNLNYRVSVSTHNVEEPCVMKIGIKGPSFNDEKEIEIPPNSEKSIDFELPFKLKDGDYNLTAKGISGIKFENETRLNFEKKTKSIFIQTDKATYKPGDLVRFRVLILDPNTRPAVFEDSVDVLITDSSDNHIKQFKNIKLTKGVYAGELQLSEFPVLGDWVIEVSAGDEKETKSFEIAKYTLPKFEVTVEVPKHVVVSEKFRATVRAKYTYGKPVKGNVLVMVKEDHYWSPSNVKTLKINALLDGKAHVEIDPSELDLEKGYNQQILLMAFVEETLTGNKLNASARTLLHHDKYKISPVDAPYIYVPNKPFKVTVAVKNYDGTPVQNSKNPVKFILSLNNDRWYRPIPVPYSSDDNDTMSPAIEPQPEEEPPKQVIEQNVDENGMATVEFTIPENEDDKNETNKYRHYTILAKYFDVESYVTQVSKREKEPETDSFNEDLRLKVISEKPKLGEDVEIKIQSKDPLKYFVYQVIGRGNILESGRVNVPGEANEYTLKIKPIFEMVPHSSVYVYFVKDNSIKYKSIDLQFGNQLQNSITIDTPDKAKPGEEIDISVTTDPDSYVGLLGVDQSVLLLKSGNDLSKDDVIGEISSYRTTRRYDGFEQRPADSVGLVLLTSIPIPVVPFCITCRGDSGSILFDSEVPEEEQYLIDIRVSNDQIKTVRKEFPETWIYDTNYTKM